MSDESKQAPPPSAARAFINMLPLLILTWYLCAHGPDKNPKYRLDACGRNLHKIAVAIEKDRLTSEDKLYNPKLEAVFGKTEIPECPDGGKESYLNGYTVSSNRTSYLLVCKGDHHTKAEVPPDFPRIAFSVEEAQGQAPDKSVEEPAKSAEEEQPDVGKVQEESEKDGEGEQGKEEVEKVEPVQSPTPRATAEPERDSEG